MLVDHLPPESATVTALRASLPEGDLEDRTRDADPAKGQWSATDMLLASAVDELRSLQYLYVSAHTDKGKAGSPPQPIPRPGVVTAGRKQRRSKLTDAQRRMLDPRLRAVPDPEPDAGDAS